MGLSPIGSSSSIAALPGSLYALKYLGEQEPYGAFAANVGSGHKNGAHWIPYEEDADDDS
jgi:hypothetical protein